MMRVGINQAHDMREAGYKVEYGLGPDGGPKVLDGYWVATEDWQAFRAESLLSCSDIWARKIGLG